MLAASRVVTGLAQLVRQREGQLAMVAGLAASQWGCYHRCQHHDHHHVAVFNHRLKHRTPKVVCSAEAELPLIHWASVSRARLAAAVQQWSLYEFKTQMFVLVAACSAHSFCMLN